VTPVVNVAGAPASHSRPAIAHDAINLSPPTKNVRAPVAPPPIPQAAPPQDAVPQASAPEVTKSAQAAPKASEKEPDTERATLTEELPAAHVPPPKSVRPAAPEPFAAHEETTSIAQTFDRLLGTEIDSSFAAMKHDSALPRPLNPSHGVQPSDLSEVRELFEQLAANHVRQVRDFLIDLKWAEASRDWIAICEPAVRSLSRGAENLDLVELRTALDAFGEALTAAGQEGTPTLEGVARDRLLTAYDKLVAILPKAFALDMDRTQRESAIIQSLLLQVPDVRKVTIDKLYAAGLNSLSGLVVARADELAVATGIAPRIAERIVEKFQAYRHELHNASPDATRAGERSKIEALVVELGKQHEAFERAASAWTVEATEEKKRLRHARHKTLMQISVMLARLGEVGRLHEIEKLPFDRKLEQLRSFLKDAQEKYVAAM
jgi:hypothetical protein